MQRKMRLIKSLKIFRMLVGTVGALSMMFTAPSGLSFSSAAASPLLSQSDAGQAMALRLADIIRKAARGKVTSKNASQAVQNAIAANPGVPLSLVTAALNSMQLPTGALTEAMNGAANALNVPIETVIGNVVAHTYINQGKSAAHKQIALLRNTYGVDTVTFAMNSNTTSGLLTADDVSILTSSSGDTVYDG